MEQVQRKWFAVRAFLFFVSTAPFCLHFTLYIRGFYQMERRIDNALLLLGNRKKKNLVIVDTGTIFSRNLATLAK